MTELPVFYFQLAAAIVWAVTALLAAPAFLRAVTWRERSPTDNWKGAIFLAGVVIAGFSGRWLIAPTNQELWKVLFAFSVLTAFYVWSLLWNGRRGG